MVRPLAAENIVSETDKVSFDIAKGGEIIDRIVLPCPGTHHVTDALIAYAAAVKAGCDGTAVCRKLEGFRLDGLRQHIEHRKGQTLIIDCYNAAPNSMMAAIDVLCDTKPSSGGKRVAVLGDMLELGTLSPELHQRVGEYAAEKGIDLLVCYGNYAQYIAKGAEKLGVPCCYSADKETILNYLSFKLSEGDAVLYKASRGIHMEEIIEGYYGK